MTTQKDDFDPYDLDAIERAQLLEDGEAADDDANDDGQDVGQEGDEEGQDDGDDTTEGGGGQSDDTQAGDGEGGEEGQDGHGDSEGEEGETPAKPTGVASKDGKRVLPYSALQQARREAQGAKGELARAKAEIEALKKGAQQGAAAKDDDLDLSEEELAAIEADFPQLGKVVKAVKAANTKLAQLEKARPAAHEVDDTQAEPSGDPVQDAIDAVPDLLTWQTESEHASKFQRAVEVDNFLKTSLKWKDKPMATRFAEAARVVRAEFDLEEDQPTASQTTNRSRQTLPAKKVAAKEVINRTQRRGPTTLSDLKGGAAPARNNLNGLAPTSMLNRFESMSTEEMLAELDRGG